MCDNQFSYSAGAQGTQRADDDGSGEVLYHRKYDVHVYQQCKDKFVLQHHTCT